MLPGQSGQLASLAGQRISWQESRGAQTGGAKPGYKVQLGGNRIFGGSPKQVRAALRQIIRRGGVPFADRTFQPTDGRFAGQLDRFTEPFLIAFLHYCFYFIDSIPLRNAQPGPTVKQALQV